jgi:hypothetical protein
MNVLDDLKMNVDPLKLKMAFLKWQCRVRQILMRDNNGRPDASISPAIKLNSEDEQLGSVITLIHKLPQFSVTSELQHMAKKTFDLAQRRDQAIQFLSSSFYQKHGEFSDIFTATFAPNSRGAKKIHEHGTCTAIFEAFNQRFDVKCKIWDLKESNPFYQSTIAHNKLFNPELHPSTIVLAFEPNWKESFSTNSFA